MNIPETRAMLARPIWRRCLDRANGRKPGPPTPKEVRDAIAVIREVQQSESMLSVDAMMLREATLLLDEYGR